jgi:hypothetical protein
VFISERGAPFSTVGFARIVERAGREATLAIKAHPHMLPHGWGYALAKAHGHCYEGRRRVGWHALGGEAIIRGQ